MELALPFIVVGGVLFALLYLWLRPSAATAATENATDYDSLAAAGGLLVAQDYGRLVYVDDATRERLGLAGDVPDLESIVHQVEPSASFLELLTAETQASLRLAGRWVEAWSRRSPSGEMVVRLRDLQGSANAPDALDLSLAIHVVNEIGETLTAALSVEQVLQALLTIVLKAVPADAGEICLWDEDAQALVPRGWVGDVAYVLALAEQGGVYRLDKGITGWVARHRQPVLVSDRQDPASPRPKLENAEYQSFAAVPLQLGERFIGTFELAAIQIGALKQADLALLQAVASPITTAIYNAELYGEQVQRLDDIARVQQAAQSPASGDDPSAVLAVLGEQIARLTNADICGVLLYDERKSALVAEAPFHGLPAQVISSYSVLLPDGGPAQDIFFERDYWLSNDLSDEPLVESLGMTALVHAAGMTNTALLPLQIGARRIGLLQVGNKRTYGGFNNRDIQGLRVLASQAAVVVQSLRLVQTEQQVDTELAGLQEMTHAIGALRHEGGFYADITARIGRLMGVEMTGILLHDKAHDRLISRPPFFGVENTLATDYSISLAPGNAFTDLWRDEDAWYSNRVPTDPALHQAGIADALVAMGVQKALFAVLSVGGRRVGLIQAANKRDDSDFTERDARLLLIFGTQAAAMIENARLYREAQRRADEAEGVRRVAELAGAVNTSADSLQPTLSAVAALLSSPVAFVGVLSSDTGALVTTRAHGYGVQGTPTHSQDIYAAGADERAALSRRARLLNNAAHDAPPAYVNLAHGFGLTRLLAVPLMVGERVLGELVVANRTAPYTDEDRRALTTLAVQLASALDRVRLQEATGQNLSRRLQELDAISRVSNELNLTLEFDRVLDIIRHEALAATEASGCTIALLAPRADWHDDEPALESRVGDPLPSAELAPVERHALRLGVQPAQISDYAGSDDAPLPAHARSAVAAAIVFAEEPIGVLHLYHNAPGHFDAQAATFAATLAAKAALGYANAQRYRESLDRSARLRRRVEQLNQIFELGQMAQSGIPAETLLEAFAYSIQQSAGWDVVIMLLADQQSGVLRRVAHAGLPVETFERSLQKTISLANVEKMLRDEFRISESYLLPVDRMAQWYVSGADVLGGAFEGNRSLYPRARHDWRDGDMLLVPLLGPTGGLLGIISLDRPFNNHRPERIDVEVLEIFAHQAATTLENNRLFEQVRAFADELNVAVEDRTRELEEERDRLEALYEITSELARTLDTDAVLARALEMVARAVRADDGVILLIDPQSRALYTRAGLHSERGTAHPAEVIGARLLESGEPMVVEDLHAYDYWDANEPEPAQWHSALGVLLGSEEQPLGAMLYLSKTPARFAEPQLRLVAAAANQVATAINNADLYTLIREQAENMGVLLRTEHDEAEKSSAILESIADGVVLTNASGDIVLFNRAAERIFDANRDDMVGQPYLRLIRLFADDQRARLLGASDSANAEDVTLDRLILGERVISAWLSPVRGAHQRLGMVSVFRDVTRDVEVDRMKSEFIANVSHELRTPMTSIKGYADLLLMGAAGPVADQQRRFLDTIKANADRLTTLLNDLINISRIDSGEERLQLELVAVADIAEAVVARLQAQARYREKPLKIDQRVSPALPFILADRDGLTHVLTNLVDNAFNYTYNGGSITVDAVHRPEKNDLLISVADTGIGIPEAFRERVWGRFERYEEHALVLDIAGTGLGLSIARELVHMHGGDIWFESQVDEGTTFYVSLPLPSDTTLPDSSANGTALLED